MKICWKLKQTFKPLQTIFCRSISKIIFNQHLGFSTEWHNPAFVEQQTTTERASSSHFYGYKWPRRFYLLFLTSNFTLFWSLHKNGFQLSLPQIFSEQLQYETGWDGTTSDDNTCLKREGTIYGLVWSSTRFFVPIISLSYPNTNSFQSEDAKIKGMILQRGGMKLTWCVGVLHFLLFN